MFNGKWDKEIKKFPKMYNPKKPLLNQLGCAQLLYLNDVLKEMLNVKTFKKLNEKSLKYRKKL